MSPPLGHCAQTAINRLPGSLFNNFKEIFNNYFKFRDYFENHHKHNLELNYVNDVSI